MAPNAGLYWTGAVMRFWKARTGDRLTMGADLLLGLMLSHHHPFGRNIELLTTRDDLDGDIAEIVLARVAGLDGMDNDLIRIFYLIQRVAFVSCLPSWLFATRADASFLSSSQNDLRRGANDCCGCLSSDGLANL